MCLYGALIWNNRIIKNYDNEHTMISSYIIYTEKATVESIYRNVCVEAEGEVGRP